MVNTVYLLSKQQQFVNSSYDMMEIPDDYVRIEFIACGICGGDYSAFLGRRNRFPISLGHEFVAKVIGKGRKVEKLKVSDVVVSDLNFRCESCIYCKNGLSHLCDMNDIGLFSNRGFAKYGDIHQSYLIKVDPVIAPIRATLIEPLSCVIHAIHLIAHSLENALIVGCGSIGMLFAFSLTKMLDIEDIHVTDIFPKRQKSILTYFECSPPMAEEYDFVIDATNTMSGIMCSLNKTKKGGKICMMSHLYGLNTSVIYEEMCKKEIQPVFPLRNGMIANMGQANDLIAKHWESHFDSMIGIYNLNDIQSVFEKKDTDPHNKQILIP